MRISVTSLFEIAAAHHLPYHTGACRRLHGHNYRLEFTQYGVPHTGTGSNAGMVVDFGDMDTAIIEGYLIADNLTTRDGVMDEQILSALLRDQQDAGYDLLSLGADEAMLTDLIAKLNPPTLDELDRLYGDEPADDAFWPVLRIKVPPDVKERFDSFMAVAPGTSEHGKFDALLACVDTAALATVMTDVTTR